MNCALGREKFVPRVWVVRSSDGDFTSAPDIVARKEKLKDECVRCEGRIVFYETGDFVDGTLVVELVL